MNSPNTWNDPRFIERLRDVGISVQYAAKPDEKLAAREDGTWLVVHPDRKPKIINGDGTYTEIDMDPSEAYETIISWRQNHLGR